MASTFEAIRRLGPAAFVVRAIIAAITVDVLLLVFIMLRRTVRKRYFARRDAHMLAIRQKWDAMLSGEIPFATWRTKSFDCEIVETIALDDLEAAGPEQSARLLKFLRTSGLIEKSIFEAQQHRGWRRHRALVALGRTRAPEAIPALTEGLRDRDPETRLAALRGLGRIACPEAAEGILKWVDEAGLAVPALPLQTALVQCCAERPQVLLPYLEHAVGGTREMLGRVLGEAATPSLGTDLLQFVDDDLPELRAATARALSHAEPSLALGILSELAQDAMWFVRLRAIVSLGKLHSQGAIPSLLRGVTDSHRLVRLRAAEALVELKPEQAAIFASVVATQDRYGLYAYLTALDNAGLQAKLEDELKTLERIGNYTAQSLLEIIHTGTLPAKASMSEEKALRKAASLP